MSQQAVYHPKVVMFALSHHHNTPITHDSIYNWQLLSGNPISRSLEGPVCLYGSFKMQSREHVLFRFQTEVKSDSLHFPLQLGDSQRLMHNQGRRVSV